jgi:hypothetical protein
MTEPTPLEKLIMQCLEEPRIRNGSFQAFAKLFQQFSGITTSRTSISQWVNGKGVPAGKCGIAENLSRQYAASDADVITIKMLRPDKFGNKLSQN